MTETVLLTGATGFVGGWCAALLLNQGFAVRAAVRNPAKMDATRAAIARAAPDTDRLSFVAADLTSDANWEACAEDCTYVMHVASPLGGAPTKDPNDLIGPARDGTLRVLRAATAAAVKRVVMTSACAAAYPGDVGGRPTDETVWTDPAVHKNDFYRLSKTLAERAAWDFMATQPQTEFATILPGAVFGPLLNPETLGSVQIIKRLIEGQMPGLPRIGLCITDVRDLAETHVRALTNPQAAGERFIVAGEFLWLHEAAQVLREELGPRGDKVPTNKIPDLAIKAAATVNPAMRALAPLVGRNNSYSSAKAARVLGVKLRTPRETLRDTAEYLLASAA